MKQTLILWILLFSGSNIWGQTKIIIDQQFLPNAKLIRLTSNSSPDENKRYSLEFINRMTNDTLVNLIDSIQHAACSPPNSIFFINDSTGFFTESGGCYASYDWLYRTKDKGKTWQKIESGSRSYGNPALCRLSNKTFYMFNESAGIIIGDFKDGNLTYSLTTDGGLNWDWKSQEVGVKTKINEIQNISYSADGQVTIICSEECVIESERKKVTIIQSNNFGKMFRKIE